MSSRLGMIGLAAIGVVGVLGSTGRKAMRPSRKTEWLEAQLEHISRQLAALQQSLDAMAIEVERVGEGLRFTTKVLAQRSDANERPDA